MSFKRINDITGWVVFLIAAVVYTLTVEPTASFWDCGEFIAASYKLQVPHPPGAPIFLMVNRAFALLAGSDVTKVAFWINMQSVLTSAGASLFLFWTITLLGRKVFKKSAEQLVFGETFLLMGAGVVGALAYTFCDSAWWSAVEAEVYAMSSFFTAFVFWAILKWELIEDEAAANRWLIFTAYMIGLSTGVHLLNLVALPALGLVYYHKNYKFSVMGLLAALAISGAVILFIMLGVIPGLPSLAGSIEIFFVNSLGLPFNSGIIFFVLLFVGALVFGIYYTQKHQKVLWNTAILSFTFIIVGYSCYMLALVRSNFNPPINENDPSNVIEFVKYLKREQYGDRPLFFGPTFITQLVDTKRTSPVYLKGKDKYEIYDYKIEYVYEDRGQMLFPRLFSRQDNHPQLYRQKLGLRPDERPTFADNIKFLFTYQIGYMYFRYFGWNFIGRESDIEGAGTLTPVMAGKAVPTEVEHNRARNNFWALPLILGAIGLVFQFNRDKEGFGATFILYFLTGIALVLYLNSPPVEPRERDYIYVGSFYAFTIWIGLGVIALGDALLKYLKNSTTVAFATTAVSLIVPGIMLQQGYDDHDRSGRYMQVDWAKNLLNSCAPNAILFTGGDNDTFPLWYVQDVEGFRTDVRVCNLSLLGTEWYISQMKRKVYESEALPISLEEKNYKGKNEQIPVIENEAVKGGINLKQYMQLVKDENPAIQYAYGSEKLTILPSKTLVLPVDVNKVRSMGIVKTELQDSIKSEMVWSVNRGDLLKPDLIMLDMITNNNWERPIYFNTTLSQSSYLGLREYMQQEGYAMRLLPVRVQGARDGYVNSDIMFDNMMKKTFWRNTDNPKVYYDANYRALPTIVPRRAFLELAEQLMMEGKNDKAREVALFCLKVLPDQTIPYDLYTTPLVSVLLKTGDEKKGMEVAKIMGDRAVKNLDYYMQNDPQNDDSRLSMYILSQVANALKEAGKKEADAYEKVLNRYAPAFGGQ
ncbi:DUF2723 domain-containing protein [Cytophagaceae bacterium DM2B3-1]|uniref:DUF2723 domain-containing protein n=1 Tax=Xanthocytophaga flava TaxID=3048013 RepID=A0ABT7CT11_9BACT|nr:DUF2723 domain-containing protein [Xanthocytophaga flavus]MDJ1471968.1 DUF2723 domain-containing protein [Xanthocytophaga flavus]MDJ1496905.1 DUF2723 domain-containing protein [Xanthocytophaga flavus]